jgi:hypothetical protein
MINSPTKTLPDGFKQTHEINLAKNKGLAILLNVVGFILFLVTFALLILLAHWVRPGFSSGFVQNLGILSSLWLLFVLIVLVAFNLVLHELIHGFFFWLFTRSKPIYALHLAYAYAAAPDWFIPVRLYWIIGLAPLVIIDAAGLLLIFVVPVSWLLAIVFVVTLNTGGAVGDLLIISHLLRASPACLVNDVGDGVSFFEPVLS